VDASKSLHSMHSYFLRAGKETQDIIYTVMALSDGNSFSTRTVIASQGGKKIFVLVASFHKQRITQFSHQSAIPQVPPPESLRSDGDYFLSLVNDPRCPGKFVKHIKARAQVKDQNPIDVRPVLVHDVFDGIPFPSGYAPPHEYPKFSNSARQLVWMKSRLPLPDDENIHRSVLGYASDLGLLGTAKGNRPFFDISMVATLDHSMWFHASFRMDEWMLYEMESPRLISERGLSFGKIFRRDGTLAVTVSQEGLIRLRDDAKL